MQGMNSMALLFELQILGVEMACISIDIAIE